MYPGDCQTYANALSAIVRHKSTITIGVKNIVAEPIYKTIDAHKAWFSDGVHYDHKMGKMMELAMWRDKEGFGSKLKPDTVDGYLADINKIRTKFSKSNEELVRKLYKKIDDNL